MSYVSLKRHYFVLYDSALTLKMSKMALNPFCDETLHFLVKWCAFTRIFINSPLSKIYVNSEEHTAFMTLFTL